MSAVSSNHSIWPLTSLTFSFDLQRSLILGYSFRDALKVTRRVLRCGLERERKEKGDYRGMGEREEVCIQGGGVRGGEKPEWHRAERNT